jgi:hypothetical protein
MIDMRWRIKTSALFFVCNHCGYFALRFTFHLIKKQIVLGIKTEKSDRKHIFFTGKIFIEIISVVIGEMEENGKFTYFFIFLLSLHTKYHVKVK